MKREFPRMLVVMPAHNEAENIIACLESFARQTRIPDELRIVDDNSTDQTAALVREFAKGYPWINLVERTSSAEYIPGGKVIQAFTDGLGEDWESFDFIGKFDADILLPPNYFEAVLNRFTKDPKVGICSGLLYIEKEGEWVYEPIANRSHVRGPVKLYSRKCLNAIGGLRPSIGWDSADVLLARFQGYEVQTIPELKVKHLRPTGSGYSLLNAQFQGKALYLLNYGWLLSLISATKMGIKRKSPALPWHMMRAYIKVSKEGKAQMLNAEEGRFVRNYRWKQIFKKLF